jgi:hypothetical protein
MHYVTKNIQVKFKSLSQTKSQWWVVEVHLKYLTKENDHIGDLKGTPALWK